MKKIMVVSAHPDDEILGCGGTLIKHRESGDKIDWLITTTMKESHGFLEKKIESRKNEIDKVSKNLNIHKTYILDYPTMHLSDECLNSMISKISDIFIESRPETIYLVNRSDAHSDHLITFKAVIACTKSFRYSFIKKVLMYECISETEFAPALIENQFIPNYFVDISQYLKEKLELMSIYKSEVGKHPFPRSLKNIKALSTFRGASVGVEYAEAFQLLKWIDK